jgi:hypothetical protein
MNKKLRNNIGRFLFLKEFRMHQTRRRLVSFDEARTIGIVYDSSEEKNFELVRKYVKDLRENHHKDVLALGYYDQKELPPMRFAKLGLDFFTRKDLNWYFKPIAPVVRNFVDREFDILIDLHLGNNLPFRYVVAQSRAGFKIGRYERPLLPFYDFLISTHDSIHLPQFIEQVMHYLKSLRDAKK